MHKYKNYIYIILFILISCTGMVYLQSSDKNTKCTIQNMFTISSDFPLETRLAIHRGFIYWNDLLEKKMFLYSGLSDNKIENIALINIKLDHNNILDTRYLTNNCARIDLKLLNSGCLIGANIYIKNSCLQNYDIKVIETLARHIAGNILGLDNQIVAGTLMDFRIQPEAQHPIDANEEEIETLKTLLK